jgi:hypothetical protein
MELVDILKPVTPGKAEEQTILKAVLVKQNGKDYAKVDNSTALWGPVNGAVDLINGTEIVVAIDQENRLYVIYPQVAGGGGGDGSTGISFSKLIGDGVSKSFVINHNIGSKNVSVFAYRTASPYDEIEIDVEHTSANTATVKTTVVIGSNELTVVCNGPGLGGGGTGLGDLNYVHNQTSPSAMWTVTHGLGKYVAVDIVDSGGSIVIPDVHYIDTNSLTLTFGSATSGKAFVN